MRWGYGRVSSKGQRLYGMSLEDQLERLLAQGIDTKENWFDLKILIPMKKTASDEVQNG